MCKTLCYLLVLVTIVITPSSSRVRNENGLTSCGHESFNCWDGSACVSVSERCDGHKDCADGSDEEACGFGSNSTLTEDLVLYRTRRQTTCRKNVQWQCRDGTCISFDGKCDGVVDCPDGSDETHPLCRKTPCQSNLFRCTYGACVDGTAPCNGVQDCADNSDELLPRCRNETMEVKGKFTCRDGTVISAADHCDGTRNCPDGSDETIAACADKTCPAYLFQCAYGACVDQGADCDGKQDCADGSDESPELCNRAGTITPTKPGQTTEPATPPQSGSCVLPAYPRHGTYSVSNVPSAQPGQSFVSFVLSVSCQRGYGIVTDDGSDGNGTTVYCVNGKWYSPMPECVRFCKLVPDPSVTYACQVPRTSGYRPCNSYVAPGTSVNPRCNSPNYYSPDVLPFMKCIGGSWDKVILCKPGLNKNTNNITIIVKDKLEIYITKSNNDDNKITINISAESNNVTVNVSSNSITNNNVNIYNNNANNVNIYNNNVIVNNVENIETTVDPMDYEISEDDWRMAPVQRKKTTRPSDVTLSINNRTITVTSNDKIYFRD